MHLDVVNLPEPYVRVAEGHIMPVSWADPEVVRPYVCSLLESRKHRAASDSEVPWYINYTEVEMGIAIQDGEDLPKLDVSRTQLATCSRFFRQPELFVTSTRSCKVAIKVGRRLQPPHSPSPKLSNTSNYTIKIVFELVRSTESFGTEDELARLDLGRSKKREADGQLDSRHEGQHIFDLRVSKNVNADGPESRVLLDVYSGSLVVYNDLQNSWPYISVVRFQ